jgi:5-hydroxyisourate hydrolase-like protein (transthyretin family)
MESAMRRTIRGTVLGPDGEPAAGAMAFWIGERNRVSNIPISMDQESRWAHRAEILARTETDAEGAFCLSADYDPDRYQRHKGGDVALLAMAPGAGMRVHTITPETVEITLRLAPEVVIHGRLLTPAGLPASDVRVTLDGWRDDETEGRLYVGMTPTDEEIPSFWLRPRQTDADGRFTLEGLPRGVYASLTFRHPDYAVDDITVHARLNGSVTAPSQSFRIEPVGPTFMHTLETARPVQGRVTDKETGQPLGGLMVVMIPMRSDCGWVFHTRTDADGRYRVSGHGGAQAYSTTVYTPADSGYLAVGDSQSWPVGAKVLEKNFALDKGRIVRGQLIDADTRQPIAGAAVVYQPTRDNPNNRKYELRNTVQTNSEGRFAITTLSGQGSLAVETADESYTRVPFDESYPYRTIAYPQGLLRIDVSQDGELEQFRIIARKGIALEAKAIGPDGKVVPDVVGFCEGIDSRLIENRNNARTFADGVFRLAGADPARTYRVFLLQSARRIGGAVDLRPDPRAKQPVEVELQPTAKVHGKLVTADGSPMRAGQVHPLLVVRDQINGGEMGRDDIFRSMWFHSVLIAKRDYPEYVESLKLNAQSEFVIDNLLAAVRLCIFAEQNDRQAVVQVQPLEPGEDRNLGTITLKERKP